MKRNRDDGEEVVRAVALVCQRQIPRAQVDGLSLTPLERQVTAMKQALAPHVLLLVACGYRVRLFGRDSHVISRRCGIMRIPGQPFEYSSIPYTRVNLYVHRLVSMGYHVAFADQESAAVRAASGTKSGIFTRAVSRWYSRTTLLPSERVHTNGDLAHDAAKAGAMACAATRTSASPTKKSARPEVSDAGADDGAEEGDNNDDADDVDDVQADEGLDKGGGAALAPGLQDAVGGHRRAVDASEVFLCFVMVPATSQPSARAEAVHNEDGEADDEVTIVEARAADNTTTTPAMLPTSCEALLVSFVTQRRLSLTLETALDLEDMIQRYDIAELVLVCPSPAGGGRSSRGVDVKNATASPSFCSAGLLYKSPSEALALVPEAMLRVLQSTLSLHLGPTITGEEDGKSTSVCAVCVPSRSERGAALDDVARLYLQPYGLDGVYERLRARAAEEVSDGATAARTGSPPPRDADPRMDHAHTVATMRLSGATLRALDIFYSSIGPAGSLLHLIDHSLTACGGRRLRSWLGAPLCSLAGIRARQACVDYLLRGLDGGFVEDVLRECHRIGDVEATIGKLFAQRCTVPEYLRLLRTTRAVHVLAVEMLAAHPSTVAEDVSEATESCSAGLPPPLLRNLLESVCASPATTFMRAHAWEMDSTCQTPLELLSGLQREESASTSSSSSMAQMAQLLSERDAAHATLDEELEAARRVLKMPGLQYQTIAGTAFLLDLPRAKADLAPASWLVISRTKSNVRYHTPGIVDAHIRLCAANERLVSVAASEWQRRQTVLSESQADMRVLAAVVELVGTLDALRSLAMTSRSSGYVKPTMVTHPHNPRETGEASHVHDKRDTAVVHIRDGRHPVLDVLLDHKYVACDVVLGAGHTWLLTGPNMGGKSALMRTVGTFVVLAQIGCYVPAAAATLPVFTGVFCRMGATDAILEGSSTFLMEMSETSRILDAPSLASSLVLMDELGRGTSSFDGAAVADATLAYLVAKGCTSMFVTHYSYLCDPWMREAALARASGEEPLVDCFYMGFRHGTAAECAGADATHSADGKAPNASLVFTYKPCPGVSPSSFGVEVARMAGLPQSVLETAKAMSEKAEKALQVRLDVVELSRFLRS